MELRFTSLLKPGQRGPPLQNLQRNDNSWLIAQHQRTCCAKRIFCSDEMETLRRSRNPTTVVTISGEVQTNEEAVVNVHDLDLFVTVQILDEVLSLGKLCEEHEFSKKWASGQKPHLTEQGKNILCKTENGVPLVVPGLSSNSGTSSSSASMTIETRTIVCETFRNG